MIESAAVHLFVFQASSSLRTAPWCSWAKAATPTAAVSSPLSTVAATAPAAMAAVVDTLIATTRKNA